MRSTLLVVFLCVAGAWGFTIEDRDDSVVLETRPREVTVTLEDVVPKRDEEDTDDDLREIFNESMKEDGDEPSTLARDKTPEQFLESVLLSEELEAERRDLEMLMGSDPELLALYKEEFHEVESREGEETDTRKISAGQAVAGGLAVGAAGTLIGQYVKNKYQQQQAQQLQQSQYGHNPYQPYGHHYVHPSAYGPARPVYGGYVQPATHHYVQPAVHQYIQPSYQSHSFSHNPYSYGRVITPQESVGERQAVEEEEEEEGLLDNLANLANPVFHATNLVNHANNLANHAIVHANHLVNHANDLANHANHDDIHANNLSHLENHANDHADHHANLHANIANFAIGKQLPADNVATGGLYRQLHPAMYNIPYGSPYGSPYQYLSYGQPSW